jgi:hypothetical protein
MDYTTYFEGSIKIDPPLSMEERDFINAFSGSRRMLRKKGPYYIQDDGDSGQTATKDITNYNKPPQCQPGLWCQWVPKDDGTALEWDGGEKFYKSQEWMTYMIDHFLKPGAIAVGKVAGLRANHTLNGVIHAGGGVRTRKVSGRS